jgi:tRNA/tmRNA/rRNA uracil-C5-methylase (TrmA/RlmC/RlmD family)
VAAPSGSAPAAAHSWVGRTLELDVGAVAHGGHCVARVGGAGGRVVFVRHALPGERVRALVTEDRGGAYCRADAVEVLSSSPDRVPRPCPYAGAGRCGGCDWQHVRPAAQRELKAAVVAEQLRRLAGIERAVVVEELPGGPLGWRTRTQYAVAPDGSVGLRRHRSHSVEILDRCLIGAPGVGDAPELSRRWPGVAGLDITVDGSGRRAVSARRAARSGRRAEVLHFEGARQLRHRVCGIDFTVTASGFWQVHPAMPGWLTEVVVGQLRPRPGERALDLYAGAGLFAAALAQAVGPGGAVLAVESDPAAAEDAAANLAAFPGAAVTSRRVDPAAVGAGAPADLVVLDPPRVGAGADVMAAVLSLRPRAVSYVSCDPAALARDLSTAADRGWRLAELRAVDAFPMTQHIECVAQLLPG